MAKVLITCDKHRLGKEPYSFLVFDLDRNRVVDFGPHTDLLQARLDSRGGRNSFRPFGIAQSEDKIFIASNQNLVSFNKDTLEPIELVSDSGVVNTHQIAYNDGYIYRANTSNDTVTRIDLSTKQEIHFDLKTMSLTPLMKKPITYNEDDVHHINSLLVHDGWLYVMAHNINVGRSEVFKASLDLSSMVSLSELDYSHHEIIISNGMLYSLATASGALVRLNLETLEIDRYPLMKDNFLRGMVLSNNKLEIFASQRKQILKRTLCAFRITFDLESNKITKLSIPEMAIIACAQIYDK